MVMKFQNFLFISILFIGLSITGTVNCQTTTQKPVEFGDVFPNRYSFSGFNGTWLSDQEILYNYNGGYRLYNVETDVTNELFNTTELDQWRGSWTISPSHTKLLIRYNITYVFRHSSLAKYVIYDFMTKEEIYFAAEDLLSYCIWSPSAERGDSVAFVRENNIFYYNGQSTETVQLTTTGIVDVIYNGVPDWVYEEEILGTGGAMWFSPNGQYLAYGTFNDTEVDEFTYILYGDPGEQQYESEVKLRYPKPGRTNPTVRLSVANLDNINSVHIWIEPAPELDSIEHILGGVTWINSVTILPLWLNRRQDIAYYRQCTNLNAININCITRFTEDQTGKGWALQTSTICDDVGCKFIGFEGDKYISNLYGYRNADYFYHLASPIGEPQQRHVYNNELCLSCAVMGPENQPCTYASASFSTDFSYFALTCSGPTPTYVKIIKTDDIASTTILDWQNNTVNRQAVTEFQTPIVKFLNVNVAGGFVASVKLFLPPGINETDTSKKYPMIVDVYGGPNSVRVTDGYSFGFPNYLITSHELIYCRIDGRGSGNKGMDMLFSIYNALGTVEIEDQIAVTKYLQDTLGYIDRERTGIWGWSYGGYATAMALREDTNKVFQCGISVAPVTSWIYYDSMYTERYMDTPEANANGYQLADITANVTEFYLNNFKTHDFFLIHGNADDNVHYQNSMALSRVLQVNEIMFEQMSYPDEAHSLGGVSRHLYHTMDEFWINCLNLHSDEEEEEA